MANEIKIDVEYDDLTAIDFYLLYYLAIKTEKAVCKKIMPMITSLNILYRSPGLWEKCELSPVDQQILENLKDLISDKDKREGKTLRYHNGTSLKDLELIINKYMWSIRKKEDDKKWLYKTALNRFVKIVTEYYKPNGEFIF
jgi:hypothetical protein